jgi:DNA gyrase subunit B
VEQVALRRACLAYFAYSRLLERMRRRYDPRVLDALVRGARISVGDLIAVDPEGLQQRLEAHLKIRAPEVLPVKVDVHEDMERDTMQAIRVTTTNNGAPVVTNVDHTLIESPERKELVRLAEVMADIGAGPFAIEKGDTHIDAPNIDELVQQLDDSARKGQSIQRYKGLGEMNPDQLWETTMDPEHRTLLQVEITDAVEADQIFSDLMGDEVEPRRVFIEKTALDAVNLDI